ERGRRGGELLRVDPEPPALPLGGGRGQPQAARHDGPRVPRRGRPLRGARPAAQDHGVRDRGGAGGARRAAPQPDLTANGQPLVPIRVSTTTHRVREETMLWLILGIVLLAIAIAG